MNRLPVSERSVRGTSIKNNNNQLHHRRRHCRPPTSAWPAGMLQQGLDSIIKGIPPSDWQDLRPPSSHFAAYCCCAANLHKEPNCESTWTMGVRKMQKDGLLQLRKIPHTAQGALSTGQRSSKLNGTFLHAR